MENLQLCSNGKSSKNSGSRNSSSYERSTSVAMSSTVASSTRGAAAAVVVYCVRVVSGAYTVVPSSDAATSVSMSLTLGLAAQQRHNNYQHKCKC